MACELSFELGFLGRMRSSSFALLCIVLPCFSLLCIALPRFVLLSHCFALLLHCFLHYFALLCLALYCCDIALYSIQGGLMKLLPEDLTRLTPLPQGECDRIHIQGFASPDLHHPLLGLSRGLLRALGSSCCLSTSIFFAQEAVLTA